MIHSNYHIKITSILLFCFLAKYCISPGEQHCTNSLIFQNEDYFSLKSGSFMSRPSRISPLPFSPFTLYNMHKQNLLGSEMVIGPVEEMMVMQPFKNNPCRLLGEKPSFLLLLFPLLFLYSLTCTLLGYH